MRDVDRQRQGPPEETEVEPGDVDYSRRKTRIYENV
jgi:hypothetical protein